MKLAIRRRSLTAERLADEKTTAEQILMCFEANGQEKWKTISDWKRADENRRMESAEEGGNRQQL